MRISVYCLCVSWVIIRRHYYTLKQKQNCFVTDRVTLDKKAHTMTFIDEYRTRIEMASR